MILVLSIALASLIPNFSSAESLDPFDPSACVGETMGAEKALDILGPNWQVNLAEGNAEKSVPGQSRYRQIINGVKGKWYETPHKPLAIRPFLYNSYGRLGLKIQYGDFSSEKNYWLDCQKGQEGDVFVCQRMNKNDPLFGPGTYQAVLTDHCIRVFATSSSSSSESEWAYLHLF